jgi:hypothetical protein
MCGAGCHGAAEELRTLIAEAVEPEIGPPGRDILKSLNEIPVCGPFPDRERDPDSGSRRCRLGYQSPHARAATAGGRDLFLESSDVP